MIIITSLESVVNLTPSPPAPFRGRGCGCGSVVEMLKRREAGAGADQGADLEASGCHGMRSEEARRCRAEHRVTRGLVEGTWSWAASGSRLIAHCGTGWWVKESSDLTNIKHFCLFLFYLTTFKIQTEYVSSLCL